MKILNAYAGIGGNRKGWGDQHDVVAVEIEPDIADIYRDHFPQDKVVETDAHDYILENFQEFDFIWASPPCPTHSKIRNEIDRWEPVYPDMRLYQEVLLLQHQFDGRFAVENVDPYYEPLIEPQMVQRHAIWANFPVPSVHVPTDHIHRKGVKHLEQHHGFDLSGYGLDRYRRRKLLRNAVHPRIGEAVLEAAMKGRKQASLQEVGMR